MKCKDTTKIVIEFLRGDKNYKKSEIGKCMLQKRKNGTNFAEIFGLFYTISYYRGYLDLTAGRKGM
jgi:hypothetical protein